MATTEVKDFVDKVEKANPAALTDAEKYDFRNIDFSNNVIAEVAGKRIVDTGGTLGSVSIDNLGKEICKLANGREFMTHAEVKAFLAEIKPTVGEIDRSPTGGLLQCASNAGIDFKWGTGSWAALKAKYDTSVEEPKPNATPELVDSLPAIALKDVSTSDLKTWIADTNLNNPNIEHCDTCIALGKKYGFVKIDTEGGAYIIPEKIVVDSVKHDKATIYGKDGFKMTIPLEGSVTRADTVGNGRKFNHDIIVTNLREAAIGKNNEENALERDKVAVNAAELNKTFDTITKTFDTTMETINPEKVSQILTTYSAKKAISTGGRSAEYGYKQSINTGAKTLLSLISQLNTLKQSATDLSGDAWNAKSILLKKIDTLGAGLQEGYKKIVGIATSLDTYGKDKDDLGTYLNYLQTASVAEMVSKGGYNILLGKGGVFDDIKSLQTRLRTHSGDIAKYKGTGTIGKTFQDAYQVGIAMLDTAKADVTKKLDAAANDPANKKAFEAFKAGKRSAA